jgi:hypothetical protein
MEVTEIRTNMRLPKGKRCLGLGQKVLITGPSWSGKTSILQSLQLALTGEVYDFGGRDMAKSVKAAKLLRATCPPEAKELDIEVNLTMDKLFHEFAWKLGDTAKVNWRKSGDCPDITFPVEEALGLGGGSPLTLAKYFFKWFVIDCEEPDYQSLHLGVPKQREMESGKRLLAVMEHVRKKAYSAKKELEKLKGFPEEVRLAPLYASKIDHLAKQLKMFTDVQFACQETVFRHVWFGIDLIEKCINNKLPIWFGKCSLQLDPDKQKLTVALTRKELTREVFSGGEWSVLAIGIALAAVQYQSIEHKVIITLPDRGYDKGTFLRIATWLKQYEVCTWLVTTHQYQTPIDGYSVIDLW